MSMLAFFPWLDLDEELRLPEFSIVQFQRGRLPGGEIQTALDAVMEIYVVGDNRPVSKGTMVQLPGHTLTDDLTDDERSELFVLAELTALAGLAKREYFAPFHYANRDTFTLVIQAHSDPAGGIAVRNRRRDGSSSTYKSRGAARVRQPDHLAGTGGVRLDTPLLEGLLKVREAEDWPDFEEAIFFFNRANTDSDQVFEQAEIVATTSAFERVLGCRSGKGNDLAERFVEEWRQSRCLLPSACPRIPADLILLAKRGFYAGSPKDQIDIDVFDELACANLFGQIREEGENGEPGQLVWPWNQIRGRAHLRRGLEAAFDRAMETTAGPTD